MTQSNLHRPVPVRAIPEGARSADSSVPPERVAHALLGGDVVVVTDHYGTGANILDALTVQMGKPGPQADYAERELAARAYRAVARRLLVRIKSHQLVLNNGSSIGFLKELYPDVATFALPLVDVQELHGAWLRYVDGIPMAVLGYKIHPFYGTYVPTRTTHLELFGTWLSQYTGARDQAVDVGTGCGVLALMLAKADFANVVATDANANAIESVTRQMRRLPELPPITPVQGDLLGMKGPRVDLIVFNPPWMYGDANSLVDKALYFGDDLFPRFFDQAAARLAPGGRVVLLFSNLMGLVQPEVAHPIETELAGGRFRLVQKLSRKVKPVRGPGGKRRPTREKVEVWELELA